MKQVRTRLSAEDIARSGFNKNIDNTDLQATNEGCYINRANHTGTPKLRRYYFCDGYKFNTGSRHRNGGNWG